MPYFRFHVQVILHGMCREPRDLLAACGRQMGLGLSLWLGNPGISQALSGVPAALPCQPLGQDHGVMVTVPSFPRAAAGCR